MNHEYHQIDCWGDNGDCGGNPTVALSSGRDSSRHLLDDRGEREAQYQYDSRQDVRRAYTDGLVWTS